MNLSKKGGIDPTKKLILLALSVLTLMILFALIFTLPKTKVAVTEPVTLQIYEGENQIIGEDVSVEFENPVKEIVIEEPVVIIERPQVEITNPEKTDFKSVTGYYVGLAPEKTTITTGSWSESIPLLFLKDLTSWKLAVVKVIC